MFPSVWRDRVLCSCQKQTFRLAAKPGKHKRRFVLSRSLPKGSSTNRRGRRPHPSDGGWQTCVDLADLDTPTLPGCANVLLSVLSSPRSCLSQQPRSLLGQKQPFRLPPHRPNQAVSFPECSLVLGVRVLTSQGVVRTPYSGAFHRRLQIRSHKGLLRAYLLSFFTPKKGSL